MAEIRRNDALEHGADPERDSRIESLLVQGLDQYFLGRYEDAVHIWTRVLFLDRTHPRARAYIDRARTALAERQRRSDELLHASQVLLEQGRTGDARELLSQAVAVTGDDDRAAALRMRLDRMERTRWDIAGVEPIPVSVEMPSMTRFERGTWWGLVAATTLVAAWLAVLAFPAWRKTESAAPLRLLPATVPVLDSGDVALVRAHTLFAHGRLADALVVLDRVSADSVRRPDADRLRIEIQRLLLAASTPPASSPRRLD